MIVSVVVLLLSFFVLKRGADINDNITEQALRDLVAERSRLKMIVDTQEVSAADAQRITRDREQQEQRLRAAQRQRETAESALSQAEVAVTRKTEDVGGC